MWKRSRLVRCLGVIAFITLLASGASAQDKDRNQDNAYDSAHPKSERALASALFLIKSWKSSAGLFSQALKKESQDPHGWYFFGLALRNSGRDDIAPKAFLEAIKFPEVRARSLFELARCYAKGGDAAKASETLRKSHDAGMCISPSVLKRDALFRKIKSNIAFQGAAKVMQTPRERIRTLSSNGDQEGLRKVCYFLLQLLEKVDSPTILHLTRETIIAHAKTKSATDRTRLAKEAMSLAKAADSILGRDDFRNCVKKGLKWTPAEADAAEKALKTIGQLGGSVRGHHFDKVIKGDMAIEVLAKKSGDIETLLKAMSQRGVVHRAVIEYGQLRRRVSSAEEAKAGLRCSEELRRLAARYGELNLLDDALGGISQYHSRCKESSQKDVEDAAWAAIRMRPRLPYGSRGLGYYESCVIDKRRGKSD